MSADFAKRPMVITVAPTAGHSRQVENTCVPLTPEAIVEDCIQAATLGAAVVHVQACTADGQPTQDPEAYAGIIGAIRERAPDILVSVQTDVGRTVAERSAPVRLPGYLKPDLATLTLGSFNTPNGPEVHPPEDIQRLAEIIQAAGVVPVWKIWDVGMAEFGMHLVATGVLRPPYVCTLMLGSIGTAGGSTDNLSRLVAILPRQAFWSAAGVGADQVSVISMAMLQGGHIRVGLEDNRYLDAQGHVPATNAAQVQQASDIAHAIGRPIASPRTARHLMGLVPQGAQTASVATGSTVGPPSAAVSAPAP